jgi:NAD(P)-dependent dehydrogenase (short-subunit alcohol dehydrogenase family)
VLGIVTGASAGGLASPNAPSDRGWESVPAGATPTHSAVPWPICRCPAVPGDVADRARLRLLKTAGGADLLVNAQQPRPTPLPRSAATPDELRRLYEVNVVAPLALAQLALPWLRPGARVLNISSDAAVEAYESQAGTGPRGRTRSAERRHRRQQPLRVYAVDPRHA